MAKINDTDLKTVRISGVAAKLAEKERERSKKSGVPLSLGAIVSKAIISAYEGT